MNQSQADPSLPSWSDIRLIHNYETCRQQSACVHLPPPPRPPVFPKLFLANTTTTMIANLHPSPAVSSAILTLFLILTFVCLLLLIFGVKFQLYYKWRYRSDQAMASPTTHDKCPSLSSIVPTFYERATPSTTTTTTATTSLPSSAPSGEHSHADQIFSDHNHRTNIYEEIPSSYDYHPHCACCSCTLAHYYEKHSVPPSFSTPYYHTYEPSMARIVCQTCLLQSLHRQQQCSCHHFFVPIK